MRESTVLLRNFVKLYQGSLAYDDAVGGFYTAKNAESYDPK